MGEFFSILCALFWAISVILFKIAGDNISSKCINAYKTSIASILFVLTMAISGELRYFAEAKFIDISILVLSSFVGMTIADTLFYKSLKSVGASAIAVIEASQPPFIILLAYLFYGERLFVKDYFGATLVCIAIILSASNEKKKIEPSKSTLKGVFIGLLAIFLMSASIVIIKYPFIVDYAVIEKYPPMWSSSIRVLISSLILSPLCLFSRHKKSYLSLFNLKTKNNKYLLIASITGGYLALVFWIYGIKLINKVSIAIILNQLAIVFIMILAFIFLKEKLTLKKIIAMVLAVIGCIIVLI